MLKGFARLLVIYLLVLTHTVTLAVPDLSGLSGFIPSLPNWNIITTPAPFKADGLTVLIVHETTDDSKLPVAQSDQLVSRTLQAWLDTHCSKGGKVATPNWRIWDRNTSLAGSDEGPPWPDALAVALAVPAAGPVLVFANSTTGDKIPLPATEADTIALLTKYAK